MNLQKKIKEILPNQKGLLSDNEIVAINRRDYYMGEAGPIDGFFSAFDGLKNFKSYQDLEMLNTSIVLAELISVGKKVNIFNTVDSTLTHSIYAFVSLESNKLIKDVTYNSKAANVLKGKNKWAQSIVESLNKKSKNVKNDNKNKVEIIFTDALDRIEYEEAMFHFEKNNMASILVIRNGTHVDAKLKSNPYSKKGIRNIFDVCGAIYSIKLNK